MVLGINLPKMEGRDHHRLLIYGVALVLLALLIVLTPKVSATHPINHTFADRRNFFGVPNTLNVMSNFPFLVIGSVGLVLCIHGNYFGLSLRGEVWGWAVFFMGVAATAFGSSYYHLKPTDSRLVWDQLPMTVAYSSIMSVFIFERIDERVGNASLLPLLAAGLVSFAYWRFADDLHVYLLVHFIPTIAIPAVTIALPPKYTQSSYWLWAAACYLLAKAEELADKKIYKWSYYIVSGHTLKHLSAAMVPLFMMMMLARRNIKIERLTA